MSLFTIKKELLNEIKAIKSLNSLLGNLDDFGAFSGINNSNNVLDFLLDLLKSIVGLEQLKAQLVDFLTYNLEPLEQTIKQLLISFLGEKYNCGIDAKIPDDLVEGLGDGFNLSVKEIDFFGLLKVDPNSIEGEILYGNIDRDLNRFIYDVLQGNTGSWKGLVVLEYLERGIVEGRQIANVIKITIDPSWEGKSVNQFITTLVNSINLYSLSSLVNQVVNLIFSPITSLLNKSRGELRNEAVAEEIVTRIINLPDVEIDNSYFEFNRQDEAALRRRVDEKARGYTIIESCGELESFVDIETLVDFNNNFALAVNEIEQKNIITDLFTTVAENATRDLNISDANNASGNIVIGFFNGVIKSIINILISPKMMLIFKIYLKIVGQTIGYVTFEDFFNRNRAFFIDLIRNLVLPLFIEFVLNLVKKELTQLVIVDQLERQKEMLKNRTLSIISLLGINTDII